MVLFSSTYIDKKMKHMINVLIINNLGRNFFFKILAILIKNQIQNAKLYSEFNLM